MNRAPRTDVFAAARHVLPSYPAYREAEQAVAELRQVPAQAGAEHLAHSAAISVLLNTYRALGPVVVLVVA